MIKVFDYIEELDCFSPNETFKSIVDQLGLTEWHEVVWIGRYFALDNDFGEHWFDNWDERDTIAEKATALGLTPEFLFVINPERFKNNKDGPCHTDLERKLFWTDVCKSLSLSLETIFTEARKRNNSGNPFIPVIPELEDRINEIKTNYTNHVKISKP